MGGLEERICAKAAELGFCKAGFTTAGDFPRVSGEAVRHGNPQFFQDTVERGTHPSELFSRTTSIIVLVYDCSCHRYPESLLPYVARTCLSRS